MSPERWEDGFSETSDEVRESIGRLKLEGRDEDAILAAEDSLHRSVVSCGPSSPQTREIATDLVLAYNHLGMKMLSNNDIKGSLRLLQKAKLLTGGEQPFLGNARLQARAVTLNNLGCLMKKWGKPRVGVAFLARALRIEAQDPGGADNPAGTHVNMSAALSSLGMHRAAAAHAGYAINLAFQMMDQVSAITAEASAGFCGVEGGEQASLSVGSGVASDSSAARGASVGLAGDGSCRSSEYDMLAPGVSENAECLGGGGDPTASALEYARGSEHLLVKGKNDTVSCEDPADVTESGRRVSISLAGGGIADICGPSHLATGCPENGRGSQSISPPSSNGAVYRSADQESDTAVTPPHGTSNGEGSQGNTAGGDNAPEDCKARSTAGGLLAIAYFNLAVEREHLGQLDAALGTYENARAAAHSHLGPKSQVTKGIELALETASATAHAAAVCSRKRRAKRPEVACFPSIGKLRFVPRTQGAIRNDGSSFRRRRQAPWGGGGDGPGTDVAQSRLQRAYVSPRPCPPPCRTRCKGFGQTFPRSPSAAHGPQRAGKWTSTGPSAPQTPCPINSEEEEAPLGNAQQGSREDQLLWRARACAESGCSPRQARQAQLAAREADEGAIDGDPPEQPSLSPRWVE